MPWKLCCRPKPAAVSTRQELVTAEDDFTQLRLLLSVEGEGVEILASSLQLAHSMLCAARMAAVLPKFDAEAEI